MKNYLKKTFAVATAIAAMSMSVCANAAPVATYDSENKSVAVADAGTFTEDTQMTVVVVPSNFGETDSSAESIFYINQATSGTDFDAILANMGLKAALETPGDYVVRIGGADLDEYIEIAVSDGQIELIYGDVYQDEDHLIDINDVSALISHVLKSGAISDETILLQSNVYGDDVIDISDVSTLIGYVLKSVSTLPVIPE